MLTGPIPATEKALKRSGLSIDQIDHYEVNEAFASVPLAWAEHFGADPAKLNPRGGAIALGPPARRLRRAADDHDAQRPRGHRRALRPADHVRGRRHGQRDHHRKALDRMEIAGNSAVVTGGASGLGLATARALAKAGAKVTIIDLPTSAGRRGRRPSSAAPSSRPTSPTPRRSRPRSTPPRPPAPLRAVVHCAGRGGPVRVVEKDGSPGSLEKLHRMVNVNLIGTFNVLRLAAARMAAHRAGRRRARRVHPDRVGRRVRGPDRPDPLRLRRRPASSA